MRTYSFIYFNVYSTTGQINNKYILKHCHFPIFVICNFLLIENAIQFSMRTYSFIYFNAYSTTGQNNKYIVFNYYMTISLTLNDIGTLFHPHCDILFSQNFFETLKLDTCI